MGSLPAHPHDHAVVIGVRRYADSPAGWVSDLQGPDNDAEAVAEWLQKADGGGLPAANVRVARSALAPDPFPSGGAEPHQSGVMQVLDDLAQLPKNQVDGQYAGRRLYVYVSGHGWSRDRGDAALITAEATKASPANVLVSDWIAWMINAAPFQELVLWADMCATVDDQTAFQRCALPKKRSGNQHKVKVFTAFAAQLSLIAVEAEMADKKWHGAFTYALLQGLAGAAAGAVTSDSLRDYLRNNMKSFMRPDQLSQLTVAQEPAFGTTDPMEFAPLLTPAFKVTLTLPQSCVGQPATIGTTRSAPPAAAVAALAATDWEVELQAGHYAVYVDGPEITLPFTVPGGGDVAVTVP
ncbi:MAG TPA: caspase family protein [Baekduia sp.]|nr:caspase family protein [Baekduia sp.]